jgi:hypothetical protein
MKEVLFALLHLAVMTANLCGASGVRAVIAENLLLNQQRIVLRHSRKRVVSRNWIASARPYLVRSEALRL